MTLDVVTLLATETYPSFRAPRPINPGSAIASNPTAVLGIAALRVAWRSEVEDQLRALAATDALTGVANWRGFDLHAQALIERALASHQSMTALMFGLDHFKRTNDTHGHGVSNHALPHC